MNHIKFIILLMLKLCNPNEWKCNSDVKYAIYAKIYNIKIYAKICNSDVKYAIYAKIYAKIYII